MLDARGKDSTVFALYWFSYIRRAKYGRGPEPQNRVIQPEEGWTQADLARVPRCRTCGRCGDDFVMQGHAPSCPLRGRD